MSNKLSVILLSYKSGNRLINVRNQLNEVLNSASVPYELIIIDDGSLDGSFQIAEELERTHVNIKAYELSRNYTSHYALFAGFSVCEGDCAIVIADDDQQPYQLLVDMYREWENKKKMPQAIRPGGEVGHRFFAVDSLRTWIEQLNEGEIKNR